MNGRRHQTIAGPNSWLPYRKLIVVSSTAAASSLATGSEIIPSPTDPNARPISALASAWKRAARRPFIPAVKIASPAIIRQNSSWLKLMNSVALLGNFLPLVVSNSMGGRIAIDFMNESCDARDLAIECLTSAFASGEIDEEQLDTRLTSAFEYREPPDIFSLVSDLRDGPRAFVERGLIRRRVARWPSLSVLFCWAWLAVTVYCFASLAWYLATR